MPVRVLFVFVCLITVVGCSTPERKPAVPLDDTQRAEVPGIPKVHLLSRA